MIVEALRSFFVSENNSGAGATEKPSDEQAKQIITELSLQKNESVHGPIIDVDEGAPEELNITQEEEPGTSIQSAPTEHSDEESQREHKQQGNKRSDETQDDYMHRIWYGQINVDDMTEEEKREWELPSQITPAEWIYLYVAIAMAITLLIVSLIHVAIPDDTPFFAPPKDFMFWFANLGVVPLFWMLLFVWAIPLDRWGWRTNYTRKGTHFSAQLALLVILLAGASDTATETESFDHVMGQLIWSAPVQFWASLPYLSSIRHRLTFFRFGFRSQDRPEDRPYTLFWNAIQISTTLCFQLLMTLYYTNEGKDLFPLIPVLVVGLGDGAAEPVGVRWGKHKYTTYGCCTSQRYTRSLEGSACVFFVSVVAIAIAISDFESSLQVGLAFLLMPLSLTLTEAW
eukprot:CAMPEP_0168738072 /NCGR_PEP_ID=MMETSP0724-20121128/10736_1 /TAXON_ID=265536 /ORGANISM="Amphiprora sp., Strain CCMP467" /LENGTH=399 /DNA_ID=CAMNT_0008785387 /DNA_START=40 /DNA_END=1236 /DNA_ORIENTATION=-